MNYFLLCRHPVTCRSDFFIFYVLILGTLKYIQRKYFFISFFSFPCCLCICHWQIFHYFNIQTMITNIQNKWEENTICYKWGTFYLLNNSISTLGGELRVSLHFLQLKKKKIFFFAFSLWNTVGGKLTSHHTSISYILKTPKPDSLVYDFSFKWCYNGCAKEKVQLK